MRGHPPHLIAGLLSLILFGLLAGPAAAQGRGFVEAGGLLDIDPTQRSQTTTTSGLTAGAGVFITPRATARIEFELPQWHESNYSGRGRVANHIEAYSQREERRSPSVSLLFGYHIRSVGRVGVELLVGGTRAKRTTRSSGFTERYTLEGALIEHHDYDRRYGDYDWLAVSFGSDATIAVTNHLAVVAQLRVHSYLYSEHTSLMFFRPRLSVRWQF